MNKIYLHDTWRIFGSIAFVFYIAIPLTFGFLGAFFSLWGWTRDVFIADGAKGYLLSKNVKLNFGARHSPTTLQTASCGKRPMALEYLFDTGERLQSVYILCIVLKYWMNNLNQGEEKIYPEQLRYIRTRGKFTVMEMLAPYSLFLEFPLLWWTDDMVMEQNSKGIFGYYRIQKFVCLIQGLKENVPGKGAGFT